MRNLNDPWSNNCQCWRCVKQRMVISSPNVQDIQTLQIPQIIEMPKTIADNKKSVLHGLGEPSSTIGEFGDLYMWISEDRKSVLMYGPKQDSPDPWNVNNPISLTETMEISPHIHDMRLMQHDVESLDTSILTSDMILHYDGEKIVSSDLQIMGGHHAAGETNSSSIMQILNHDLYYNYNEYSIHRYNIPTRTTHVLFRDSNVIETFSISNFGFMIGIRDDRHVVYKNKTSNLRLENNLNIRPKIVLDDVSSRYVCVFSTDKVFVKLNESTVSITNDFEMGISNSHLVISEVGKIRIFNIESNTFIPKNEIILDGLSPVCINKTRITFVDRIVKIWDYMNDSMICVNEYDIIRLHMHDKYLIMMKNNDTMLLYRFNAEPILIESYENVENVDTYKDYVVIKYSDEKCNFVSTPESITTRLFLPNGSANLPSISFRESRNSGLYYDATKRAVCISVDGETVATFAKS